MINLCQLFFFDCIKDERKPIEKANQGNARIFSVGPMNFTILMRKYTAFFQSHCMHNCTTSGSAVGINPHSQDWAKLLIELDKAGKNYIAGDFEKWDKWIPYPLFMRVCEIINNFYNDSEHNKQIRMALFGCAYGSIRIALSNVYRTTGGLPSGISGTAVFSSIANKILKYYMFIFMRNHYAPKLNLGYIDRLIVTTAYGDDHIVSVNDLVPWFNMKTLAHAYEHHDIPYTSADKSTTTFTDNYVTLENLTYLKRRFVPISSFQVSAPLCWEVIEESMLWRHKGGDARADLVATCTSALIEATHHGRTRFKLLDRKITRLLQELNITPPVVDYIYVVGKMRDDGMDLYSKQKISDIGVETGDLYTDMDLVSGTELSHQGRRFLPPGAPQQ